MCSRGRPGYEVDRRQRDVRGPAICSRWSRTSAPRRACSSASSIRSKFPGVSYLQFVRESLNSQRRARGESELTGGEFIKLAREQASLLGMDAEMLKRPVNVGFSGGEKKRAEMVQMGIMNPKFAILDETDSGLDIDALSAVGAGINRIMRAPDKGVLLITHYQRLLDYVTPDKVHVLSQGRIVRIGRARACARARARRLCGGGRVSTLAIIVGCIAFMIVAGIVRGNPGRGDRGHRRSWSSCSALITLARPGRSASSSTLGDAGEFVAIAFAVGFAIDALYGLLAPDRQKRRDKQAAPTDEEARMTAPFPTRKQEEWRYADLDALQPVWEQFAEPLTLTVAAGETLEDVWLPTGDDVSREAHAHRAWRRREGATVRAQHCVRLRPHRA